MEPGYKRYDELQKKEPQVGDRVFMRKSNQNGVILTIYDEDIVNTKYFINLDNGLTIICSRAQFVLVP